MTYRNNAPDTAKLPKGKPNHARPKLTKFLVSPCRTKLLQVNKLIIGDLVFVIKGQQRGSRFSSILGWRRYRIRGVAGLIRAGQAPSGVSVGESGAHATPGRHGRALISEVRCPVERASRASALMRETGRRRLVKAKTADGAGLASGPAGGKGTVGLRHWRRR